MQQSKKRILQICFLSIHDRYNEIIKGLNLTLSLDKDFEVIRENFGKKAGRDYAASRGEYLNGKIMAAYLGFTFVDAAEVIRFNEDGSFNDELTNKLLAERLEKEEYAVNPRVLWCKRKWERCDIFKRRL